MPTLLLVDDNQCLASFAARHLQRAFPDLEVFVASCWRDALETALQTQLDVAVVDRRLPDGDGLELCRALPRVRTILTTADLPAEELLSVSGAENIALLPKPFEIDCLLKRVSQALDGRTAMAGPPQLAPAVPSPMHRLRNRAAALQTGLVALREELASAPDDPVVVRAAIDEYLEPLIRTARDLAGLVRTLPDGTERGH